MAYYLDWALRDGCETVLNEFLPCDGTKYAFLIRHPQRAVRSLYLKSTSDPKTGWTYFDPREAGFEALHALWMYLRRRGEDPVVVDADDVLADPPYMMMTFSKAVGLGDAVLGDHMCSWECGPVQGWDAWPGWHDEVQSSTGFRKGVHALPDVDGMPACVHEAIASALPLYREMHAERIRPLQNQ